MAYRVYDIFNAKLGSTQVVGATQLEVTDVADAVIGDSGDDIGEGAVEKGAVQIDGRLACQDLEGLQTLVALFEAAESLDVMAEGKLAGDAAKSVKLLMHHAKLGGFTVRAGGGQAATVEFTLPCSVDAASDALEDEVVVTEIASKTITFATGLRAMRLAGATFTPNGGSPLTPVGIESLELRCQGRVAYLAGDDEWGKIAEVSGYSLQGSLTFRDETLATNPTIAQQLCNAGYGVLVVPWTRPGGAANYALTLAALEFFGGTHGRQARQFGGPNRLSFRQRFVVGTTHYTLATGTNKLIAVGAAA